MVKSLIKPNICHHHLLVLRRFAISETGSHGAVIYASNPAQFRLSLTRYTDMRRFTDAVNKMNVPSGNDLEGAMKLVRDSVFTTIMGGRAGVPNIVVLVTDGVQVRRVLVPKSLG